MHRVGSTGNTAGGTRRKERRVTYVLRNSRDSKHCSGVNALLLAHGDCGRPSEGILSELDVDGEVLFSGGRDGTVKRWMVNGSAAECSATFESHVDWVNDIVLIGSDTLVSCSSDTTIKTWRAFSSEGLKGECTRTLRQHSDYVKALAAAHQTNLVASGGLGCEVYVWDLEGSTVPVARAPMNDGASPMLESGSYGGMGGIGLGMAAGNSVHASSIADRSSCMGAGYGPITHTPVVFKGHKESVYALAMNDAGTVLASGGTEKAIRIWDPRTGAKQMKLKGHADNIRCLLLDPAGRFCLSGSSDHIIRLWDLGQQRCVHAYATHTDSVWTLASTSSFNCVYSGGRDKCVYRTDLATKESILLFREECPVLRIALEYDSMMWVSTTDSTMHKWPASERGISSAQRRASSFSAVPRARQCMEVSGGPAPLHSEPAVTIAGTAGIVQHCILNDRRHVLTKDMTGEVCLWEITNGRIKQRFGNVPLEEKEKELFEKVSVPSWFTMDTRLGSISVHLDTPQCFAAEMYAVDLCVPGATEEMKLNLGEHTLRGLFCHWMARRQQRQMAEEQKHLKERLQMANGAAASREESDEGSEEGRVAGRDMQGAPSGTHGGGGGAGGAGAAASGGAAGGTTDQGVDGPLCGVLPAFDFPAECPPSIITEGSAGGPWRRAISELEGAEDERDIPQWCLECLIHKRFQREPSNAKCSFYLHPCEGSQLPCLSQSKLSAPKILRIQKVMNYVVDRLCLPIPDECGAEQPVGTAASSTGAGAGNGTCSNGGTVVAGTTGSSESGQSADGGNAQAGTASGAATFTKPRLRGPLVEIICNDQVLPSDMSLATVRAYVWKKPDDLCLFYRRAQR